MENEVNEVIKLMQGRWPSMTDYNVNDDEQVEIIADNPYRVIDTITTDELDKFWNIVEGVVFL